jgi:hypothetical protein
VTFGVHVLQAPHATPHHRLQETLNRAGSKLGRVHTLYLSNLQRSTRRPNARKADPLTITRN